MMESGIGIQNPLWFVGVVENNMDPQSAGRVQCRAFGVHGSISEIQTVDLPWAVVLNTGFSVPPLNSWVFGVFIDGRDCQQPVVIGVLPTQMTAPIDPQMTGWGAFANQDYDLLAMGSRPQDLGQPSVPKLARSEYLEDTYIMPLEATKVQDVPMAATDETWSEPGSSYGAKYPHNKVLETPGGHTIEVDDTPGAERIMVYHRSGSYVQIDPQGVVTDKSVGDKFGVNEENMHVYVGGTASITVAGDARVLVNGSMFHEVLGDYSLKVRGNAEFVASGQLNIQSADQLQVQGARTVIHSMVADVDILAKSDVTVQSGAETHISSAGSTRITAADEMGIGAAGVLALDGSQIRTLEGLAGQAKEASGSNMPAPPGGRKMVQPVAFHPSGSADSMSPDDEVSSTSSPYTADGAINHNLVDFLKQYEGEFIYTAKWDNQQWTNGFGTKALHSNETITYEEGLRRFHEDVAQRRSIIVKQASTWGYKWGDQQIDALTSFAYNIGSINGLTGNGTRSDDQIASMMLEFNKATDKHGNLVEVGGLTRRREAESKWFISNSISSPGVMV